MKKIVTVSKFVLAAGLLVCTLNSCKNEPKQEDPKEVAEDSNDAKFDTDSIEDDANYLVDIAAIDKTEIEIGKLAQERGVSQQVKDYGKMLVADHTKSLEKVTAIALTNNVTLPATISEKGQEEYDKLKEKSGKDFDKEFMEMMVDGHQKAVDKISEIADKATDPALQTYASEQVSVLTGHLEKAKLIKKDTDK